MTFKTNIAPQDRGFFFALSGDDILSGKSLETPKKTIQAALDAANALSPFPGNAASAIEAQGGVYAEALTLYSSVFLTGSQVAVISSAPVLIDATGVDNTILRIQAIINAAASGTTLLVDGNLGFGVILDSLRTGADNSKGIEIKGSCDSLFFAVSQLQIDGDGSTGIEVTASSPTPIDFNLNTVLFTDDNQIFFDYKPVNADDVCDLNVSSLTRGGVSFTGITAIKANKGVLKIRAGSIVGDTAFDIATGGFVGVDAVAIVGDIKVATGSSLGINSTNQIVGDITVDGIFATFSSSIIGDLVCNSGSVTHADIQSFDGNITVNAGATLYADINTLTGTVTNNGTINGVIDGVRFGNAVSITDTIIDFSPGLESTSGSVPLVKATIVIPAVDATFLIEGSAMVSFSNVNGHSVARLFNSTDASEMGRQWEVEQEDSADVLSPVFRQEFAQTIAAGAKTIEFQYFVGFGTGTLSISDCLLTAHEVNSV